MSGMSSRSCPERLRISGTMVSSGFSITNCMAISLHWYSQAAATVVGRWYT